MSFHVASKEIRADGTDKRDSRNGEIDSRCVCIGGVNLCQGGFFLCLLFGLLAAELLCGVLLLLVNYQACPGLVLVPLEAGKVRALQLVVRLEAWSERECDNGTE